MPIVNASKNGLGYDFSGIFEQVGSLIKVGDIAIANLETTITEYRDEYSGYSRFKSPVELVGNLKEAGFDVLTTANNHSYDNGDYGIETTIKVIEENKLYHTGTFIDSKDHLLIMDVKRLKIGIVSYTYGTNGLRADNDYMVNYIDKNNIKEDYEKLIEKETDIQIISLHWGTEYQSKPDNFQMEIESFVRGLGFDIVLGSHPHVLQKITYDENYFGMYSMGNFLSNQRDGYKDLGVIVDLVIEKFSDEIIIRSVKLIPTWVNKYDNGALAYKILPLTQNEGINFYLDQNEKEHIVKLLNHFYEVY
ncbi:MAG: CapA family protein, partial [Bacillota bacterium]|nr:CapA family protein [Bacillota bacterium]